MALASVLALQPEVLVLDEPTSQLDPQAAEEVLIALRHLNEDLGLTLCSASTGWSASCNTQIACSISLAWACPPCWMTRVSWPRSSHWCRR